MTIHYTFSKIRNEKQKLQIICIEPQIITNGFLTTDRKPVAICRTKVACVLIAFL